MEEDQNDEKVYQYDQLSPGQLVSTYDCSVSYSQECTKAKKQNGTLITTSFFKNDQINQENDNTITRTTHTRQTT
jgi:hypothetical protein